MATATQAPGILVTGFGKASGSPNIARTTVGVEIRAATADQALTEVNRLVAQVIQALKAIGIAEGDLRTQNVALHFERDEHEPRPTQSGQAITEATGRYRASNSLEVTIRALDRAGAVLGAAAAAGANQMFGIEFEIEDRRPLEAEARQKAVADARARAEALASLAGVRLGPAVSIVEGGSQPMQGPMLMMRAEASQVPVERGELTITTSVNVLYALPSAQ